MLKVSILQLEQLEVNHSLLLKDSTAVEACHQALDARMHLLDAAEQDLSSQQAFVADQLLQLCDSQEQFDQESGQLQDANDALCQQEEQTARDRAILVSQTQRLSEAATLKSAELDAQSQKLAELTAEAAKQRSAKSKPPAHKPSRAAQPRNQPLASLANLEQRQQELESQKAQLKQRHRQLAEDLSSKQLGLNQQWAELDIDQRRAEARDRELKSQTTNLQAQWEVLEAEWNALEAEKAQAIHFSTPSDSVPEASQGSYQSCRSETGTEDSEATQVVRLSEQEVEQWRSSLEKQLSDVAVEWAAVNAERTKLKVRRLLTRLIAPICESYASG